jgi:hypothetical protein
MAIRPDSNLDGYPHVLVSEEVADVAESPVAKVKTRKQKADAVVDVTV